MKQLEEQELRHNKIKLFIAIVGVFITIFGIGIERWAAYEQRSYVSQKTNIAQRIERMNQIGEELDGLVKQSIQWSVQRDTNELFLKGAIENTLEEVKNSSGLENQRELVRLLSDVNERLNDKSETLEWKEAIELQAEWDVRKSGFTPDFESFFGKEIQDLSIKVAESA